MPCRGAHGQPARSASYFRPRAPRAIVQHSAPAPPALHRGGHHALAQRLGFRIVVHPGKAAFGPGAGYRPAARSARLGDAAGGFRPASKVFSLIAGRALGIKRADCRRRSVDASPARYACNRRFRIIHRSEPLPRSLSWPRGAQRAEVVLQRPPSLAKLLSRRCVRWSSGARLAAWFPDREFFMRSQGASPLHQDFLAHADRGSGPCRGRADVPGSAPSPPWP